NTRQITKAMKMVSAAKLRRAQERALAGRPYAQMLTNVLLSLVQRAEIYSPETGEPRHPLLVRRPEQNVLLIVVSGDKGLAGAFNTNIVKAASKFIAARLGKNINVDIEAVGRKGRDFFRRRYRMVELSADGSKPARLAPVQISGEQVGILNRVEFSHARDLAQSVIKRYVHGEIDAVYVLFNEFKSVISQRVVAEQVLPIQHIGERDVEQVEAPSLEERARAAEAALHAGVGIRAADTSEADARAARFGTAGVDYIYEQPAERLFNDLLPRYVAVQIFRALLESVAAEHAARMTAMESATNNASDMIDALTLQMNRVRQAKITKEIIEIVSGAAAAV
ncbi:MAG TPA: ATP synthase F1 subunit gamma, partial [Terriglobales bacterium]|nr:ATP synthase F1 subunit gamma [Terriglobales bacterium]